MKRFSGKIINRLLAIILVIALWVSAIGSLLEYALASNAYSTLGTNVALGSPILNPNFTAEEWNKWEMITWGIFLSNFATPFVDDYNSAFNQDAGYGSKGSGAKALQFGSGQDVANNKTIQGLLDYAINQQSMGAVKPIYVAYAKSTDGRKPENTMFTGASAGTTDATTDGGAESTESDGVDPSEVTGGGGADAGLSGNSTNTIRQSTVADLFFKIGVGQDGETWADITVDSKAIKDVVKGSEQYRAIAGAESANIPMFAIRTSTNAYEKVFDYTDSYDLNVMELVITRAVSGDYGKEFAANLDKMVKNPSQFPLVLDCFGNICTMVEGKYKIIIPAAANKWLTTNPSINMVNSLIFNACTKTSTIETVISNGGQAKNSWWHWAHGGFPFGEDGITGGYPAFSNGTDGVNNGQAVVLFDTDTIVVQDVWESNPNTGSTPSSASILVGDVYKKLFDLDINDLSKNQYSFKIEPANLKYSWFDSLFGSEAGDARNMAANLTNAASQLINQFNSTTDVQILTTLKTDSDDLEIFGKPVIVAVQQPDAQKTGMMNDWPTGSKAKYGEAAVLRHFLNYAYQAYSTGIKDSTTGSVSKSDIDEALSGKLSLQNVVSGLVQNPDSKQLSPLMKSFAYRRNEFYTVSDIGKLKTGSHSGVGSTVLFGDMMTTPWTGGVKGVFGFSCPSEKVNGSSNPLWGSYNVRWKNARLVKAYSTSDVMTSIANILGVREGTEFALYSMYIYMTYLDWYGITGTVASQLGTAENTSKLNSAIFDGNSDVLKVDIKSIATFVTEEQKEKEILNWTYMLLNPTEGREYRSSIIISGIADWIYDQYQKIVYGSASNYYINGSSVTSHNTTGFMTVSPYSENFLTAWLVNNYALFATYLIAIFIILTIISGILQKRKFSWFLVTIVVMVNMILVLPAMGEVAPLISNNFVQSMFSDKMNYWAISESITNATMESDYVTNNTLSRGFLGKLTKDEHAQVVKMVKNLNTLYLDRSLSIKQDISKKVTSSSYGNFEELQNLRSARWMLPMIMRQFTANDGSANYVYIPLGDKYDDLSNMYWYYNPEDALGVDTINAQEDMDSLPNYTNENERGGFAPSSGSGANLASNRDSFFADYVDLNTGYASDTLPYKAICWGADEDYERYAVTNEQKMVHAYSFMIADTEAIGLLSQQIPNPSDYKTYDEWAQAYSDMLVSSGAADQLKLIEQHIELCADEYSRFERDTVRGLYSYLWTTENPFHYFYDLLKDCFQDQTISMGSILGDLQGSYVETADGKEVRKSLMHAKETGYVRDCADLESLFKNVIPYIYSVQLMAEGYTGDGVFVDDPSTEKDESKISKLAYYKDITDKSWLFRSNWVTKIMENKEYHASAKITDAAGNEYEVANMLIPSCYPDDRPMVFSEAQMYAQGLQEYDLSLIELKCVQVNKDIMRQWTMLLNYASLRGLTKEVLVRQMAFDALIIFNAEFTPIGLLNGAYTMYPNGLDLRSISFDSIMKMLMINVTHDTSYIYGDTMQTLVEDSDIFTAILLLITAAVGVWILPLFRSFVMAAIFFMGLWSIVWSIMKSVSTKTKVSCGYVISNILFAFITFCYYLLFDALMAMTTSDEVLTISQIEVNTGNPVWCMLSVLLITILYGFVLYKLLVLCVRNIRDMGFEVYRGIAEMAAHKVSNGLESIGEKISGLGSGNGTGANSRGTTSGRNSQDPIAVMDVSGSGTSSTAGRKAIGAGTGQGKPEGSEYEMDRDYESSGYTDTRYKDDGSGGRTSDIDSEINKGKEIARQEKAKEDKQSDRKTEPKSTQS